MTSPTERWELFPHGADVGVRGIGPTREAAFAQVAIALTGAVTDPNRIDPKTRVGIRIAAPDEEILLLDWLNALVFESATRGMLFSRFAARITAPSEGRLILEGEAWGEPVDAARHEPATEVKGATLTLLKVTRQSDGLWIAQCVVDV